MDSGSRRRKLEPQECERSKEIRDLPRDVALDIASRLPMTSLMQFRFVCRAWNMLSHDPQLVHLYSSITHGNSPYLILHNATPLRNHLYFVECSDHKQIQPVRKIQVPFRASMPEFNVIGSCNGLLCLSDSLFHDTTFIYNPFTGNYKKLPECAKFQEQEVVSGFGLNPIVNEYKVVKIIYYTYKNYLNRPRYGRFRMYGYPNSEVQVCGHHNNTWRGLGKAPYQLERGQSGTLVDGRLHWLTKTGTYYAMPLGRIIVSFDLEEEQFRDVPGLHVGSSSKEHYQLTVLGGCLSVVDSTGEYFKIWVMKEYGVTESWQMEYTIRAYPMMVSIQERKQSRGILTIPLRQRQQLRRILKGAFQQGIVRPLCVLKNGQLLLQYKGRSLVCYDPQSEKIKQMRIHWLPNLFQTFVHVGSLNRIEN